MYLIVVLRSSVVTQPKIAAWFFKSPDSYTVGIPASKYTKDGNMLKPNSSMMSSSEHLTNSTSSLSRSSSILSKPAKISSISSSSVSSWKNTKTSAATRHQSKEPWADSPADSPADFSADFGADFQSGRENVRNGFCTPIFIGNNSIS